jgi:hypothetical protein
MKAGDSVKCNLFDKRGVVVDTINLSTPSSSMEVVKLLWNDGEEETVNVTAYPSRICRLDEAAASKEAFGKDLAEP